jgi:hypothetical protein
MPITGRRQLRMFEAATGTRKRLAEPKMWAFASTEGRATIRSEPRAFVEAFRRRVETGLLSGKPEPRSRYELTSVSTDRLAFRASDWSTALNVGLNEVDLEASAGAVRYRVRFRRWAKYCVALAGTIGGGLMVVLFVLNPGGYVSRQPGIRGLSTRQAVYLAWSMAAFWGFVWPWILIALHKPSLRRLMKRIIADVESEALHQAATPGGASLRHGSGR